MDFLSRFFDIPHTGGKGICRLSALELDEETVRTVQVRCPGAARVIVVLFPYLVRDAGNVSLYARGLDYHAVIMRALEPVCARLRQEFSQNRFVPLVDASPLPEVRAAWVSGAGILGQNGLIFDRTYGSFVFIGTVLTDLELPPTPSAREICPGCGACTRACPAQALQHGCVDEASCLSALTQSKQPMTEEQLRQLAHHPLVWGCDICSLACPLNRDAAETTNPAFRGNRICSLEADNVDGLTRKQFLAAFPERAFIWRGPAPLARNLSLKRQK